MGSHRGRTTGEKKRKTTEQPTPDVQSGRADVQKAMQEAHTHMCACTKMDDTGVEVVWEVMRSHSPLEKDDSRMGQ